VHDDVGAQRQGLLQQGRGEGVVHDHQRVVASWRGADPGDVGHLQQRVGGRLDPQQVGVTPLEPRRVVHRQALEPPAVDPRTLLEQASGPVVAVVAEHDVRAVAQLADHGGHGCHPRGEADRLAALEAPHELLEGRPSRDALVAGVEPLAAVEERRGRRHRLVQRRSRPVGPAGGDRPGLGAQSLGVHVVGLPVVETNCATRGVGCGHGDALGDHGHRGDGPCPVRRDPRRGCRGRRGVLVEPERAERFAADHEVARAHGRHHDLLEAQDLDVVYVATTNDRHHADALACLAAGIPVLVEKPFALDLPQAREVVEEARTRGLFLMEAMWMRFQPAFLEVERRIEARRDRHAPAGVR
jgi:hypothetical protein